MSKNSSTIHSTTPQTATAAVKVPQKRGRKGDKIKRAFMGIPTTPTDAVEYAKEHGISLVSLQQSKRFDQTGLDGKVHVKKDKATGTLMVWRDSATVAADSSTD